MLDYSKLESGNVEITVKRSNLQEALSTTVHSSNLKGEARQVRVKTKYNPNVPEFIHTDARRLSQVLYNLLNNASKFSNLGGTVEFSVAVVEPDGGSQWSTEKVGSYYSPPREYQGKKLPPFAGKVLRFVVKDYGRGVNERDIQKIFLSS